MTVSIRKRIYLSFSLLVILIVLNGIITVFSLNNIRNLSKHLSDVVEPSLETLIDFRKIMIESKSYTTNCVFLRSAEEDKKSLQKLHSLAYPALKSRISTYSARWQTQNWVDSLNNVFTGFENLIVVEKSIMADLKSVKDYDNPVVKAEAERKIEEEVLPRTEALLSSLNTIHSHWLSIRNSENIEAERSPVKLRLLIIVLAITIICIAFFLSIYMAGKIINPINKIRHIVNDLGNGVIRKAYYKGTNDEIGEMVNSVNNLSERLRSSAAFAKEIGNRNFNTYFKPSGPDDSLGLALVAMRDNIKLSDEKLNDAQHIAHIGSWERDIKTDKLTLSDEMLNIFDIDPLSFDFQYQSLVNFIHVDDKKFMLDTSKKNLYLPPVPYECRIVTSKGTVKNIFVQTKAVTGESGKAEKTFGIVQDITARKQAEEKIKGERELFRLMIESMPDQIYLKDADSRFLICNMPVVYGAGLKCHEEIIGKTDFNIFPLQASEFLKEEEDILKTGTPIINREGFMVDKITGKTRWSLTTKVALKNSAGKITGLIGINRDITERKISEKKIEDVNRELSILFNSIDEVFFSINTTISKVIQISKSCEKLYGYVPSDFLCNYKLWSDIIHPDDKYIIENKDEILRRGEQVNNQYRVIRKDKFIRWVETNITPTLDEDGKLIRIDGVTRDITERKNAEEYLQQSNQRFELATKATNDAIWDWNLLTNEVYISDAYEKHFGYNVPENKMHISSWSTRIHPDDATAVVERIQNEIKTSITGSWEDEYRYIKQNGDIAHVFDRGQIVYDDKKKPVRMVGAMQDITPRKKAETQLQNSEESYRQIVETAQEGIWLGDENNRITFVNKKMAEILEYSPEEMIGKEDFYFMYEKGRDFTLQTSAKRKQGVKETYELQFITKNGRHVWTHISANPIFNEDGLYKGSLAMVTDITKRKLDEELLQRSQANLVINNFKLEQKNKELEQFAYVASHDLQEPLQTTISFVQILKQKYLGKLDPKADKYLDYISQASDRMRVLIQDLLDFSRIGINKDMEQVDCNTILKNVIIDLDKALKDSGAKIQSELLPVVNGYATELKQLFQNLISNSIKFRKKDLAPVITISAQQKNDYWQFAFTDNGIGIDPQHNERIFIIFQRLHTRKQYHGSGIGLSHCKKIAELHHGKIWVEPAPCQGSAFYFILPITRQGVSHDYIKSKKYENSTKEIY